MKRIFSPWCSSSVSVSTCIQLMTRSFPASFSPTAGTLFSALQAITHAWQPVQRSKSITMPQSATSCPPDSDLSGVEKTEASGDIRFVAYEVVGVGTIPAEQRHLNHIGARSRIKFDLDL